MLSEEKRAQIVDAAVEEFLERGFAAASMDRIAGRAGVSKRTVYKHFAGKEALFHAILEQMAERVAQALDLAYRRGRPIEEQLRALGWAEGRLLLSPDFMRLARVTLGETLRDRKLAAQTDAKMQQFCTFQTFIADAQADGALKPADPAVAAEQFLAMIKARAFWPVIFSGVCLSEAEMGKAIDDAVAMFLAGYRP